MFFYLTILNIKLTANAFQTNTNFLINSSSFTLNVHVKFVLTRVK